MCRKIVRTGKKGCCTLLTLENACLLPEMAILHATAAYCIHTYTTLVSYLASSLLLQEEPISVISVQNAGTVYIV